MGAMIGAGSFHFLALKRERRQNVAKRTQDIIDQFFSKEFISHRAAIWKMREQVLSNSASISHIAAGFIYPMEGECYDGSEVYGLTEHEHLTLYFGFIERLGLAVEHEEINAESIKKAFCYEFVWHADLIRAVAKAARAKAEEGNCRVPSFAGNVDKILELLGLGVELDQIDNSHFPLKEHEKND